MSKEGHGLVELRKVVLDERQGIKPDNHPPQPSTFRQLVEIIDPNVPTPETEPVQPYHRKA